MNEYYIGTDENGNRYLCHGIDWKNHKYIKKIGEGKLARYFYTPEELKAYLNAVARRMQQTGETAKAAGAKVSATMQTGANTAKAAVTTTARKVSDTTQAVSQKVQEKAAAIANKSVKQNSEKANKSGSLKTTINNAIKAIKQKSNGISKESTDSAKPLFKSATGPLKNRADVTSRSVKETDLENTYRKANPAKKADILLSEYEVYKQDTEDIYQMIDAETKKHLDSDMGKKANGIKESSHDISDIDAGEGYHGAAGHKKNVSGEAKEGSMKIRRKDGSDPHAEKDGGFNIYDDDALDDYVEYANQKFEELGGLDTPEAKEYAAKVCAEVSAVAAARTVQAYRDLKKVNDELEKAKQETEAVRKEIEDMRQRAKNKPNSVTSDEVNWARAKMENALEKQEAIAQTAYDITAEIDDYKDGIKDLGELFNEYTDKGWAEVLGIDPRFAGNSPKAEPLPLQINAHAPLTPNAPTYIDPNPKRKR